MQTVKFTAAKTETLKQAINLLDMFRLGSSLKDIKAQAKVAGVELTGRSFKAVYPQLVSFYENALNEEEAETLTITTNKNEEVEVSIIEETAESKIEAQVDRIGGGWIKRKNTRNKLISEHDKKIQIKIDEVSKNIRSLISSPEQEKRKLYAIKSKLNLQLMG